MPLRCIDDYGISIEAHERTPEEWAALKDDRRIRRHLTMPCCQSQAIPKTSNLGTQFFAHKARGNCPWKHETEVHRHLKALALRVARSSGWNAQTEESGTTPDGEKWIADVFAQNDDKKIAIEIQWSGQTNEETLRRQHKYRQSGVTGIWLLRQPDFPVSRDLPAAYIGGSLEKGLKLFLPRHKYMTRSNRPKLEDWSQIFTPEMFLVSVFENRLQFGIPDGTRFKLDILAIPSICTECRERIYMITALKGKVGPHDIHLYGDNSPQKLAREYPSIREKIKDALIHRTDVAKVDRTHVPNGHIRGRCPKCNAWTPSRREYYPREYYVRGQEEAVIGLIDVEMTGRSAREGWHKTHWAVWPPQPGVSPGSGNWTAHTGCD